MAKKTKVLKVKDILAERQSTHGDFSDGAKFCQVVMRAAEAAPSWGQMTDVQKEAFHMIAHKMQRIVTGNPHVKDHWDDIAGYAVLASERIA